MLVKQAGKRIDRRAILDNVRQGERAGTQGDGGISGVNHRSCGKQAGITGIFAAAGDALENVDRRLQHRHEYISLLYAPARWPGLCEHEQRSGVADGIIETVRRRNGGQVQLE